MVGSKAEQLSNFLEQQLNYPTEAHISFMCNSNALEHIAVIFDNQYEWSAYVAPEECEFITSDSPLVRWFPQSENRFQAGGYGTPGQELVFPVSKAAALILRNHNSSAKTDSDCCLHFASDAQVLMWNLLQLMMCDQYIYAATDCSEWAQSALAGHLPTKLEQTRG
jgi:hypothetical protein